MQNLGIKTTDDSPKYNYKVQSTEKYAEYSFAPCTGTVLALRKDNKFVDQAVSGDDVGIVLDQTNFYAEQGGQIFDEGFLVKVDDEVISQILSIQEIYQIITKTNYSFTEY